MRSEGRGDLLVAFRTDLCKRSCPWSPPAGRRAVLERRAPWQCHRRTASPHRTRAVRSGGEGVLLALGSLAKPFAVFNGLRPLHPSAPLCSPKKSNWTPCCMMMPDNSAPGQSVAACRWSTLVLLCLRWGRVFFGFGMEPGPVSNWNELSDLVPPSKCLAPSATRRADCLARRRDRKSVV